MFTSMVKDKPAEEIDREGSVMNKKNQERGVSSRACPLIQQEIIFQVRTILN